MKIAFFGNSWTALQVLGYLRKHAESIGALVLHPKGHRKFGEQLIEASSLDDTKVFDWAELKGSGFEGLRGLGLDMGVSVSFGYIFQQELIKMFPSGCINLHPSLLPYNKGGYPNVWSIVENTPAGVTLHHIDPGVDTGDVISQHEITVEPTDTGETLYRKLERASVELFEKTWPSIEAGDAPRIKQDPSAGTSHLDRDVDSIDHIHLDKSYEAGELLDILRARTFPPHRGAYFVHDGKKVYIRVTLQYEDEL